MSSIERTAQLCLDSAQPQGAANEWLPIETAPFDFEWECDLPDNAIEGMGWAVDELGTCFLFLVWYERTPSGSCRATKWCPLPAAPAATQGDQQNG